MGLQADGTTLAGRDQSRGLMTDPWEAAGTKRMMGARCGTEYTKILYANVGKYVLCREVDA